MGQPSPAIEKVEYALPTKELSQILFDRDALVHVKGDHSLQQLDRRC